MQLEVGSIYEGKVTGITKFGAFVELESGKTGMVHISEVANTYVNDIKDHIQEGQTVKVKVMSIGEDGKIALSIKKALPQPERPQRNFSDRDKDRPQQFRGGQGGKPRFEKKSEPKREQSADPVGFGYVSPSDKPVDAAFEDMLSKFKASSEDKMSDLKRILDPKKRSGNRRGK